MIKSDLERLDHIEKCINTSAILLTKNDGLWLVSLAKKVQQMEMKYENTGAIFGRQNMRLQIDKLTEENKRLREALKFYSNEQHYFYDEIDTDSGRTARQALKVR